MILIAYYKTAVVVSSLAVIVIVIEVSDSGFGIVTVELPFTLVAAAETFGLIPANTKIPSIVWPLLSCGPGMDHVSPTDVHSRVDRHGTDAECHGHSELSQHAEAKLQ